MFFLLIHPPIIIEDMMVTKNLDYSQMSCLDRSSGDLNSLVKRGSKVIIDKYVKLKNRKLASNGHIRLTNKDVDIIENAKQVIMSLVINSIDLIYEDDYSLIYAKQSERSVCSRLAYILQEALKVNKITNYFVDVEYVLFKKEHSSEDTKNGSKENKGKGYCDLLIHSRGKNKYANILLAIEMKVHTNGNMANDINRLKLLTSPWPIPYDNNRACDSLLGLFVVLQKTQFKYKKIHRREDRSEPTEENWIPKDRQSYKKLKKDNKDNVKQMI